MRTLIALLRYLDCRFVVPMQNGDLDAKGILASIIKKEGTIESFKTNNGDNGLWMQDLLARELPKAQVLEPIAGVPLEILPPTSDV
ncbi:hypothetical protein DY000_02008932 [Brassica cretica]|uniref:Uncharacterized protein n=1 Tax=Brassica cretica TaxID=69181 RepID=A0ABQ7C1R0_BRACR|nr:hypothetical protein DY000_02008932 [Brassica cretica]